MRLMISTIAIAGAVVFPALAQEDAAVENMTCAEFAAMDGEGRQAALDALAAREAESADQTAPGMREALVQEVLDACEDAPDGLALDALTTARGN